MSIASRRGRPGRAGRYTAEAWWEVAHTRWLGTVVPVLNWIVTLLVALDVSMTTSLWPTREAGGIILIWSTVDTRGRARPSRARRAHPPTRDLRRVT